MNENKLQEDTIKLSKIEKRKAYDKAHYEANKEARKQAMRDRYDANKEARSEYVKAYYEANKEAKKQAMKAHYEANKEARKQASKDHYEANKEAINKATAAYAKRRMQTDELYCAKVKLRQSVVHAFRRIKQNKPASTITLLGCTWEEAKQHFEEKFQLGMHWANHGEWHIDHIVPIASATTIEEVMKLNHISNLQPLWAEDNRAKGCR